MKKLLIISDSHGNMDNVRKIKDNNNDFDLVIHLGDIIGQEPLLREMFQCKVVVVKGNCDFYSDNNLTEVIKVEDSRIFATHGHNYGVDWGVDQLSYVAEENNCNIAMYGHTHVPEASYRGKVIVLNPGSISRPRQLNRKPTYIIMEIDKDKEVRFDIKYV